ncbi:FAD/NAD(P)-binding domain-containing protein [Punctularia strigosozonata HHB-11173 SS5]|uniref:FAD/NAD(P)-binding domain-containing protein n=1 Tax=Punctularia strigosozonata (strain HHB-11173) TaxID=741275 RepID=UPI0004418091|nr:FAD/NAD(P)-binding domain-containing protein [Punctularia strigosozonata HHB-11173 SS5]EIN06040.1 FAD/NAD(P)-binding domain-containing protein [Punctularia strigosozonata HHB-11173 SS5]
MATESQPHILIAGAGLGGLALAQGLKAAGIPFTLFERDSSAAFRPQGYRIRLNPDGSGALHATLPTDVLQLFMDTCPEIKLGGTNFNAKTGEIAARREGFGGPPPRPGQAPAPAPDAQRSLQQVYNVDRTRLRQVLMHGLVDQIRFGKTFVKYTLDPSSPTPVTAHFADGTTASGTFLVGADGVRSAVRATALPADIPGLVDTDGRFIYGKTLFSPELTSRVPPEATERMTVISTKPAAVPGPGMALPPLPAVDDPADAPVTLFMDMVRFSRSEAQVAAQQQAQLDPVPDYIYWVLGSRALNVHKHLPSYNPGAYDPDALDAELFRLSPDEVRDLSLRITADWHPSFRPLVELQLPGGASILRITSAVPVPPPASSSPAPAPSTTIAPSGAIRGPGTEGYTMTPWDPSPYVTFLGDAVHPMSPTGGSGANTALSDAANLLKVFTELFSTGSRPSEEAVRARVGKYEEEMRAYAGMAIQGSYHGGRMLYAQRPWTECKPVPNR